ncbi:hypothetical protein GGS20DRAFT_576904 [Poronia punctata]|nr:hypothetical protein GGS20DRAFT_576904 [Poronia punctata]
MSSPTPPTGPPPYASRFSVVGGIPTIVPDVPISAVFLFIYLCFAITNMTILQINKRRRHKFLLSGLLFGFSMSRIVTFSLRIAWATHRSNVRLSIASNIFANAGVLVSYIVNLVFAQRILRARRPGMGWHKIPSIAIKTAFAGVAVSLVLVVYSAVQTPYTLDPSILRATRAIQLAATTYLFVFTTLPLFLLLAASRASDTAEAFGKGSMRTKMIINTTSTCLAILISGFKTGTIWEEPRLLGNPAWYHSRAAFYVLDFVLEVFILGLLTFSRVDKRFHVPDGSRKAGDYSTATQEQGQGQENEKDDDDDGANLSEGSTTHQLFAA